MIAMSPRASLPFLLLAGVLTIAAPATAQDTAFTGTCEDVFVPGYPDPEAQGTPTEQVFLIPGDVRDKAFADCEKRAKSFFKTDDKAKMALVRAAAIGGDVRVLPDLLDAAGKGVSEASFLIAMLYVQSPPVSPAEDAYTVLPRKLAEEHLRKAAEEGLPAAAYVLGRSLESGQLTKKDLQEARRWFLKLEAIGKRTGDANRTGEAALELAIIALSGDAAPADDQARLPDLLDEIRSAPRTAAKASWIEARARRLGIGFPQDVAGARALVEKARSSAPDPALMGEYITILAASPDTADRIRLAELLQDLDVQGSTSTGRIAGIMLYEGVPAGRDRRRALSLLEVPASYSQEDAVLYARRAAESGFAVKVPPKVMKRLYEAVDLGLPGADVAALDLLESGKTDARDTAQAIALGAKLRTRSDAMKLWSLAKVAESGASALYYPFDTNEKAAEALDGFVAQNVASAMRIKAVALRKGTLYRQDDAAATQLLIKAAGGGDAPAMLLLADAYGSGKGIEENDAEEVRWLLAAAKTGSVEGERAVVWNMPFASRESGYSVHDAMVMGLVLQGDDLGYDASPGFDRPFTGPEIDRLGADYIVSGLMDGFRASMGLRRDEKIVQVFKSVPKNLTLKVEAVLQADGFFKGKPDGFMGPEARTALVAWARAKGLPEKESDAVPAAASEDYRLSNVPVIAPDRIEKIRTRIFSEIAAAKDAAAQKKAVDDLQMLAQYGDLRSRLEILRAYAGSNTLKPSVVLGIVMLYGLDVLAAQLPEEEKATTDFIFAATTIARYGAANTEADVILITLRDDPRFRDFQTFDKIADQFVFVGGLCEVLAERAKANGVPGLEEDACSGTSRRALIAWAKAKGPDGSEATIRRQAAEYLQKLPD